jgi:ubiquinone/menaquinone biosynthesis C-methylase UbiE
MSAKDKLLSQCSNPSGWFGKINLWTMNLRHSKLTDWGLAHITVGPRDTILDVGCGGGRTMGKLADLATEGKVYGIDHSETSVASSRKTNAKWIALGRVDVQQGSVSRLSFPDNMFDLVTAVETQYFWPDLPADMREIRRVLKPGGRLVIIAEAYRGGKHDKFVNKLTELANMAVLTVKEHEELFASTGYQEVQVTENYEKGWLCGIGTKPS